MKRILIVLAIIIGTTAQAQSKSELQKHYDAYYKQMKTQGDNQGIINALTHLLVLNDNSATRDTLAYLYMNSNKHMQALNTIGIDKDENASDIALQVKAVSLKQMRQPKRAIEQFEIMYKRDPSPYLAYELADLHIQTGNNVTASVYITSGLSNTKDDMKYAYYETQQPYEVPLKAAFTHIKGLITYNNNKENLDSAIAIIDEALKIAPNFNLAKITRNALVERKNAPAEKTTPKQ